MFVFRETWRLINGHIFRVNSPVYGEFPAQSPVTQGFDVFLICALNKREAGDLRRQRAQYDVILMKEVIATGDMFISLIKAVV